MPCDTVLREGETKEARSTRAQASAARLEAALSGGRVQVVIGPKGEIAFKGWSDAERDGVADGCIFRRLDAKGSFALRQAIQRAEIASGRKLSREAIAGGSHSHDGGKTWGTH